MTHSVTPNEGTELGDAAAVALREVLHYVAHAADELDRGLHKKLPRLSAAQATAMSYLVMMELCEGATAAAKYYGQWIAEKGPASATKRYLSGIM